MKLLSIKLCNFRQFYGKTPEIHLAASSRNTTVIYGNNGAGKTTILNACTWVLYEKFTAAFAEPELLVNKRSITEVTTGTSIECSAEVNFEHENKRYQVKRKFFAYQDVNSKIKYGSNSLYMLYAGDDGNWYTPNQPPEDIINQILPESLHRYFFFDGEYIDHQFRSSSQGKIAEDTKELLGVKVLDRAIEHLKKAKKSLQDDLKDLGESDLKKLLKQESKIEQDFEKLKQRQQDIINQLSQQEELKKAVTNRLLELSGAEELKQLKEKLEQQERNLRQDLVRTKDKLKKLISQQAYQVFLKGINQNFQQLIDRLRQQGELPSGIKQQFVQQLLERKKCICGQELQENSQAYLEVQDWMNKAGMADVEEAAIRLSSTVKEMDKRVLDFWQEVDNYVESELDEVRDKFRHYPDEDIKNLQSRLDAIEDSLKDLRLEQGSNKNQLDIYEKELESLQKQVQKQQQKEEKYNLGQRRILATQEAINRISEVRQRLENQFRLSLEKRVQEIFSSISFTPYIPRISPDYEVRLLENTTGFAIPVAASTGENQILSLSFIGGIIDRVCQEDLINLHGVNYSLVKRSPNNFEYTEIIEVNRFSS